MKNNQKNILVILSVVFVLLLAACDNSSAESSATSDNHSQYNNSANENDDSSSENVIESASNSNNKEETGEADDDNANEKEDNANNVSAKEEDSSTNTTEASLQEEYLKKLSDAKSLIEELEPIDSSTYALKEVENDRWDIWDELLNDIYGVLNEQLPQHEMDQLREEQRDWINYRDDSALEASQKFKGGTHEHVEYVAVLANLTEERCYELVKDYM